MSFNDDILSLQCTDCNSDLDQNNDLKEDYDFCIVCGEPVCCLCVENCLSCGQPVCNFCNNYGHCDNCFGEVKFEDEED